VPDASPGPSSHSLGEIARVFLKLGFLAFGGPAAHTAMMQDELVHRRKWLDEEEFLDAVAAVQVVPGPNSTELAIHMGQLRGGFKGLLVAGACFIGPAVLIILPLAVLYVAAREYSETARRSLEIVMHTVSGAVLGVILVAGLRLMWSAVKGPFGATMLVIGLLVALQVPGRFQPEILALAVAAIAGIAADRVRTGTTALGLALPLPLMATGDAGDWARMAGFFLKVGATLFGSGYVLVNYLESGLTAGGLGWLTDQQVLDAIAVGQVTPGPLLTTSTFAGYVIGSETFGHGWLGSTGAALLATGAMFLPAFVFVALLGPLLSRLRKRDWARSMLAAMGAAAVGLILAACVTLAPDVLAIGGRVDPINLLLAVVTAVLMLWRGVNATWLMAAALLVGGVRSVPM
jgi:chromate transporter